MLKPLTLSLSLAVALGACSVSMAGLLHGGGGACASPQCPTPSPQGPVASAQCETGGGCFSGLGSGCFGGARAKLCGMGTSFKNWCNKPKCYTYEWVLKKKRVWGCHSGAGTCETCVTPSAQAPYSSPQAYGSHQGYGGTYGSGQAYGTGQAYGATQMTSAAPAPAMMAAPAPAPTGDEAPPAPEVTPAAPSTPAPAPPAPSGPQSSLLFSTPSGN